MPELRKDPIVDRWVIIAPNRATRPQEFAAPSQLPAAGFPAANCPFCPGNEDQTPAASYQSDGPDGGWNLRVVPNRYPAVTADRCHQDEPRPASGSGSVDSRGYHEVVIETARHVSLFGQLDAEQVAVILYAYRARLRHWRTVAGINHCLLFKNVGPAAGASLFHLHSQIMALPRVPQAIQAEFAAATRFYDRHRECIYCDMLQREQSAGKRIFRRTRSWVAWAAYAGRQPFETWLLPSGHQAHFDQLENDAIEDLAKFLHDITRRIEEVSPVVAYNVILHTASFDNDLADRYHWHFEIIPRITQFAGFELGTGEHVNPVAPEDAAAMLRDVAV